jgi:PAT family beta-lactamase induction signal transducer AmpG
MLALGFSSGFPYLLVFGTLSYWLKDINISYKLIGAFSLVKIPYSLKWAWSPLIDNIKLPILYKMGRRRSWALFIQVLLFFSLTVMSFINPLEHTLYMALAAFIVSFLSASQDIVLDAFRVESFENEQDKQASGVAIYILGYRIGLIFSGAGAIYLASYLSWSNVYLIMSLGIFLGIMAILSAKEPEKYKYKKYEFKLKDGIKFLKNSIVEPFKNFAKHKNWMLILLFIFTYRLSDAYFNPMSFPFYIDMGFTKNEIASVIKIYGMIATIIGSLVGGIIVMKIGLKKSLLIFGITQCITTMLFAVQAGLGHNFTSFVIIVSLENFSSGLATTAMVAYISSICDKMYTATQYALLSSVMSLSRDIFASTSGFVVEKINWEIFFIISGLMSLPAILIILFYFKDDK